VTAGVQVSSRLRKITNAASVLGSWITSAGSGLAFRLLALTAAGCRSLLCCFLSDAEPFSRRRA